MSTFPWEQLQAEVKSQYPKTLAYLATVENDIPPALRRDADNRAPFMRATPATNPPKTAQE